MQILTSANQEVKVIPRRYATTVTATLRNEDSKGSVSASISATVAGNYLSVDLGSLITFQEGQRFYFTLSDGQGDIYRDLIFLTDQDTDAYKIQEVDYKQTTSDNKYNFA